MGIVQAKGNQKKLKVAILKYGEANEAEIYNNVEMNKGRLEIRETRLYRNVCGREFQKWSDLNDIIVVKRSGIRDGKEYDGWPYYISSRTDMIC